MLPLEAQAQIGWSTHPEDLLWLSGGVCTLVSVFSTAFTILRALNIRDLTHLRSLWSTVLC